MQLGLLDVAAAPLQDMAAFLQAPGCKGFVYCINHDTCLNTMVDDMSWTFVYTHHLSCLYLFLDNVTIDLDDNQSNWITLSTSRESEYSVHGVFTVWELLPALVSCPTS